MRPTSFDSQSLRNHLFLNKIAELPDLKRTLGACTDITVFRKLKLLGYLSSYSHRGRFYTLREIARFDHDGLWSHDSVWFSRHGTLVATVEAWTNQSRQGLFADDLAGRLHVEVHDALLDLVRRDRLRRAEVEGRFLYTCPDARRSNDQVRLRQSAAAAPLVADPSRLLVTPDELNAAALLFHSLLDEQQRRLYAGLESIKLGRGGDTVLAELLDIDPHTVACGRKQLLERNVVEGRARRPGGGRTPTEKKRPKSSN